MSLLIHEPESVSLPTSVGQSVGQSVNVSVSRNSVGLSVSLLASESVSQSMLVSLSMSLSPSASVNWSSVVGLLSVFVYVSKYQGQSERVGQLVCQCLYVYLDLSVSL